MTFLNKPWLHSKVELKYSELIVKNVYSILIINKFFPADWITTDKKYWFKSINHLQGKDATFILGIHFPFEFRIKIYKGIILYLSVLFLLCPLYLEIPCFQIIIQLQRMSQNTRLMLCVYISWEEGRIRGGRLVDEGGSLNGEVLNQQWWWRCELGNLCRFLGYFIYVRNLTLGHRHVRCCHWDSKQKEESAMLSHMR